MSAFETILLSRSFKFTIGADESSITVYEAAVADQSPALASLIRESPTGEIKLQDVDKGTFLRFIQFAYTGDYSTAQTAIKRNDQHPQGHIEIAVEDDTPQQVARMPDWGDWGETSSKKDKKKKGTSMPTPALKTFTSLSYPLPEPRYYLANTGKPTIIDCSVDNSIESLLDHASLYALASKWGVDTLKQLTLSKLHRILSTLRLDTSRVQDIANLARYTYLDEHTRDLEAGIDELRELVCLYITANAAVTSEHTAFAALLKEGGSLPSDLWKLAVPRIRLGV